MFKSNCVRSTADGTEFTALYMDKFHLANRAECLDATSTNLVWSVSRTRPQWSCTHDLMECLLLKRKKKQKSMDDFRNCEVRRINPLHPGKLVTIVLDTICRPHSHDLVHECLQNTLIPHVLFLSGSRQHSQTKCKVRIIWTSQSPVFQTFSSPAQRTLSRFSAEGRQFTLPRRDQCNLLAHQSLICFWRVRRKSTPPSLRQWLSGNLISAWQVLWSICATSTWSQDTCLNNACAPLCVVSSPVSRVWRTSLWDH